MPPPNEKIELKPCPFCEYGESSISQTEQGYVASCDCGITMYPFKLKAEAVRYWNTRFRSPECADLRSKADRLEEQLSKAKEVLRLIDIEFDSMPDEMMIHFIPERIKNIKDFLTSLDSQSHQEADKQEEKWRWTEKKNGHVWGVYRNDEFESCSLCGIIRRADDKNSPCVGKVKISLREQDDKVKRVEPVKAWAVIDRDTHNEIIELCQHEAVAQAVADNVHRYHWAKGSTIIELKEVIADKEEVEGYATKDQWNSMMEINRKLLNRCVGAEWEVQILKDKTEPALTSLQSENKRMREALQWCYEVAGHLLNDDYLRTAIKDQYMGIRDHCVSALERRQV